MNDKGLGQNSIWVIALWIDSCIARGYQDLCGMSKHRSARHDAWLPAIPVDEFLDAESKLTLDAGFHGPGEERLCSELPVDVAVLETGTFTLFGPLTVGDAAVGDGEPAVA